MSLFLASSTGTGQADTRNRYYEFGWVGSAINPKGQISTVESVVGDGGKLVWAGFASSVTFCKQVTLGECAHGPRLSSRDMIDEIISPRISSSPPSIALPISPTSSMRQFGLDGTIP